jgi:fatty-acyl-CoA synthase
MPMDLFDVVDGWAESRHRDKVAVWSPAGTRTYRELRDAALEVAAGLASRGVGPGSRVGLMMGNRIEHVEAYFAVATLGAVAVPVNVLLRGEEATHICRDSDVSVVLVDQHAHRSIDALRDVVPQVVDVDGSAGDYQRLRESGRWPRTVGIAPESDLVHYYTSGTTGRPKAAVHTHRNIVASALHQIGDLGITQDDVFLVVSSFTWAAGFNSVTMSTVLAGGTIALLPTGGVTLEGLIDHVERSSATSTVVAPTLLRQLSKDESSMARLAGTTLRTVFTGGEPLGADVILRLHDHVPEVGFCQAYGLSEFPIVAAALLPHEAVERAGTAGRATTGNRLAVRTHDGQVVGHGEGELLIRSNATMRGYLGQPEATAEAFTDGWLNTGDLVVIDEDDYVTVVGRKKDMIISGGLNIYPAEIENVANQLAGVQEVAVVGIPDENWGEAVAMVVVSSADLRPDDVVAFCRERLATYKVPRHVHVQREPLPRNPSGKLLKAPVRRDYLARASGEAASAATGSWN